MTRTMRPLDGVIEAIRAAQTVALVCHISPDGDTVGSALALRLGLLEKDKQVALDAEGNVLTGYMTKYQIAKERITKIKEESFFRDGVK